MGQNYSGTGGLMLIIGIPVLLGALAIVWGLYELLKWIF